MTSHFLLALVILFQYVGAVPRVDPLVDSKVGLIRGQVATDGDYSMFLGIPYAKVDEANPFGPSYPVPVFENTFEAFDDTIMCPQIDEFSNAAAGTLDCLRLNVYVPTIATSTNQLPVLVWIHTGAFTSGSSGRAVYGPKFLVRHDIILVTINYRLGPYGFLCLDTPAVSGNQGLKDQQMALRWIKDNIEAFGGDANRITLFGQSAGSKSIDFHIHLSEELLFNQAILQSGTILTPGLIKNPGREVAFQLAEHLGHATNDVNDALSFINTIDTNTIIASVNELGLHFEVCIEQQFDGVKALVTDHPLNLQVPNVRNIPLLVGCTDEEELITYGNANGDSLRNSDIIGNAIKNSFDFENDTYFHEMKEMVKQFYFGDKNVSEETLQEIIYMTSDFRAISPLQRSIRKYFDNGADNIFYYIFSYDGERNFMKNVLNITFGGAAHIDDIGYLFDVALLKTATLQDDLIMVDRMTSMWTNFAKYGDPTPEINDLLPLKWIPATKEKWNYLDLGSELTIATRPFNQRMAFLELFYLMNKKYEIGYRDDSKY